MNKNVLVRNGKHMRPMLAILSRYGIGQEDKYDRGRWISKSDLPRILESFKKDKTYMFRKGTYTDFETQKEVPYEAHYVNGTNIHNVVCFDEFEELFQQ